MKMHIIGVQSCHRESAMAQPRPERSAAQAKQRTNVTLSAETLAAARSLGLNVSAISEAALEQAVRSARAAEWAAENAAALAARRDWIAEGGAPLADLQVFRPE